MLENIGILNLSQQKEEETIWCENQLLIDVETRFDTSNCKLDRPLPKGKN